LFDPLERHPAVFAGHSTHSVLIALEDGNELVCGCMHLPALNETFWGAERPRRAPQQHRRIHVSKTTDLSRAMGSGFGFIEKASSRETEGILSLMKTWDYAYGFMDRYSYGSVACGRLDVCANLLDKPWDCAAAGMHRDRSGWKVFRHPRQPVGA